MPKPTKATGGDDSAHDLSANDKQELEGALRQRARGSAVAAADRNRLMRRVHEIARAKATPTRGGEAPS